MDQKVLNLLGIANKAGCIVTGEDNVINALSKNKVKIIFVAKDASEKTIDKFVRKCYYYNVVCNLELTSSELSSALGKERKIVGVTDKGFSDALERLMR